MFDRISDIKEFCEIDFVFIYRLINYLPFCLTHYHTIPHSDTLKIYSCGKHCEKKRN